MYHTPLTPCRRPQRETQQGQALPNPPPLRLQSSAKDAKRMGVIGAEDTKQVLPVPAMAPKMLSPIESVLVNRMREAFLGYQAYYARERAAHEAEVILIVCMCTAAEISFNWTLYIKVLITGRRWKTMERPTVIVPCARTIRVMIFAKLLLVAANSTSFQPWELSLPEKLVKKPRLVFRQ